MADQILTKGIASVVELEPVSAAEGLIRVFRLTCKDGVTVELCSLGASITRILLVSAGRPAVDIVLGYDSVKEMYESGNPAYVSVIPGRVANRIQKGQFRVDPEGTVYQLEINNEPNHLHGGLEGFSQRIWDAEIVETTADNPAVRFSLVSADGDQGYPGKVRVTAQYTLQSTPSKAASRLCLSMEAELLDNKPSPINLTQHSYFNLAGHDDTQGILDHWLRLYCDSYTPIDETSIPTRQVLSLDDDPVMDWRSSRSLRQALCDFGVQMVGLSLEQVLKGLTSRGTPVAAPYGFDHNYVVRDARTSDDDLNLVALLHHPKSGRRLTVRSTAPGVQLYTANYLDDVMKNGCSYHRWQGICIETQHYPDSILVEEGEHPDFTRGQCTILTPDSPKYQQSIEYTFEHDAFVTESVASLAGFCGTDSDDNTYDSVNEMWQAMGVTESNKRPWYELAADYYAENCPSTIDGVLGGFASVSDVDLEGSLEFVRELELIRPSLRCVERACECGAGLGRVTKGLLSKIASNVDLVESSATLLAAAPEYLGDATASRCRFFCDNLQEWEPKKSYYSLIWIQWVLSYLTDDDIIALLRRCAAALDDGLIVLKENVCTESDFQVDLQDASVTRSLRYWLYLIGQAGLRVLHWKWQSNLPEDLYPVPILALTLK